MILEELQQLQLQLVCHQRLPHPRLPLFCLLVFLFPASTLQLSSKLLFLGLQWLEVFHLSLEVSRDNIPTFLDNSFRENILCILGS